MGELRPDIPWQEDLDRKLSSPEQAVAGITSGAHIWIPPGGGGVPLLSALFERRDELDDIHIRSLGVPDLGWFEPEWADRFKQEFCFCGIGGSREALNDHTADYYPYWMFNNHKALDAGREEGWQIDVAMVRVGLPNNGGYCSFGPSVWDGPTSARRAKTVIAVMHPELPEVYGESYLHVSELDFIIPDDAPLIAARPQKPLTDADYAIAANIRDLVQDGDTIQIGFGTHTESLPGLGAFEGKKDLSYFAEMTVPGIVDLVQDGTINGSTAALYPRQCVATAVGNSLADYAIVDRNPGYLAFPLEQQANPAIIAQNPNIVAINGALTVDFSGQIGIGSLGSRYYAGVGGHQAYALGATLAPRGRYVAVIPATDRTGKRSTIVPHFPEGQIVSIPREQADTVVTEFGVARLLGRTVRERAEELISVAHPDFRGELRAASRKAFYP